MNAANAAPVKWAPATYLVEFSVTAALYVGAILLRERFAHQTEGPMALVLAALPVVPVWLMFLAVVRHYRRIDEMAKIILLRNIAFSTGIAACLIVSYSLLSDAGLPRLSIVWAWPTLAISWGIATAILGWRAQ
jgi:formate-dependent nitrite reductase membrane component NrfD